MNVNNSNNTFFINFLRGFYATNQLLNLSKEKGCFIESVCLSATIIDALLRIGLVLDDQLQKKSKEIKVEFIYQSGTSKIITERKIYEKALLSGIIDNDAFVKLEELYTERNKVVHRYIISELTTDDIIVIAIEYEKIISLIKTKIEFLEKRQINKKAGMTVPSKGVDKDKLKNQSKYVSEMIKIKHGNDFLDEKLKTQL